MRFGNILHSDKRDRSTGERKTGRSYEAPKFVIYFP
jgi:hypothetical protein